MNLRYAIALTGGIATGKSTVGSILKLLGYHVIDADNIAHTLLQKHKEDIATLFGEKVLANGEVNRKILGGIVFHDKAEREKLENFLHPLIHSEIFHQAREREALGFPYFIDIPLFFEKYHAYKEITKSLLVYAPRHTQKERLRARDGLKDQEIDARLDAQMDIEEKRTLANYIIPNCGSLDELTNKCETILEQIRKELE